MLVFNIWQTKLQRIDYSEWWGIIFRIKKTINNMTLLNLSRTWCDCTFLEKSQTTRDKIVELLFAGLTFIIACYCETWVRCQRDMLAGLRSVPDWVSRRQTPEPAVRGASTARQPSVLTLSDVTHQTVIIISLSSHKDLLANGFRLWAEVEYLQC